MTARPRERLGDEATKDVPPDPGALVESLRAFGYSLPAAIADLVDNSITAGSERIQVDLHWEGENSWISVLDDGHGMGDAALTNAMRLGSQSPRETRDPDDLGRFGLGMKTAGFSQGRSVTVASQRTGSTQIRRWDLDFVTEERAWSLLMSAPDGYEELLRRLDALPSGTLVVVGKLDRAAEGADVDDDAAQDRFLARAADVERHLAAVFHVFIEKGLRIEVHGHPVAPWDPFLSGHKATQKLDEETHRFRGGTLRIRPFVLPFHTKLSADQFARASGSKGWNAQQGFYVYRAGRLLVAGDYLGLGIAQEEHYKLCRIRIDIDNSMDLDWQIDVRKATAHVPGPLRQHLLRVARRTRSQAKEAYSFRGKARARSQGGAIEHVWQRRHKRHEQVRYVINRKHPLVERAVEEAHAAKRSILSLLDLVEETLPLVAIMQDASEHPEELTARAPFEGRDGELKERLVACHRLFTSGGVPSREALDRLGVVEPFTNYPEIVAAYSEELGLTRP